MMKANDSNGLVFEDGGDIDLDRDDHGFTHDGQKLSDAIADHVAVDVADAATRQRARVGRPSLSAPGTHSPQVAVRMPAELNARLLVRAKAEHKRVSDVIREAIDAYL